MREEPREGEAVEREKEKPRKKKNRKKKKMGCRRRRSSGRKKKKLPKKKKEGSRRGYGAPASGRRAAEDADGMWRIAVVGYGNGDGESEDERRRRKMGFRRRRSSGRKRRSSPEEEGRKGAGGVLNLRTGARGVVCCLGCRCCALGREQVGDGVLGCAGW